MKELQEKLSNIQQRLKAVKTQRNTFGNYNYRSCEDILEAVKPLLDGCTITISDSIIMIGDRIYIRATATIRSGSDELSVDGYAREAETRKGMDVAQITGAASSYARKYSLSGLLAIDSNKDPDSTNGNDADDKKKETKKTTKKETNKFKPKEKTSEDQLAKITILIEEKQISAADFKARLKKKFKVDNISDLYIEEAESLIKMLS